MGSGSHHYFFSPKWLYTAKHIVMVKEIEITLEQQNELLNVNMTSLEKHH
jgi:hypothetical protein